MPPISAARLDRADSIRPAHRADPNRRGLVRPGPSSEDRRLRPLFLAHLL